MKTIFTISMKKFTILLTTFTFFLSSPAITGQTKHVVEVSNNVFSPDDLEVVVGDTVEWRNNEGFHNVNGTQETYPDNPESFGNDTGTGWIYSHVFTIAGKYDYQCDPHAGLGMVGEITAKESEDDSYGNDDDQKHLLVINFSGMDPHNNQMLYLAVYDKNSGKEIEREIEDISPAFADTISGIESGHSYYIDFFADHNGNGTYDAPPTDHAWRLELDNATGDTTLNFAHNINFTDINWKHRLTVHFTGMNPHIGQSLSLAVINSVSGIETDKVETIVEEEFMVHAYGIEPGESYHIDFFADHNQNGSYDAPPADHAWRLELNNVTGDTTLNFEHNTNFTDIINVTSAYSEQFNTIKLYPNPATNILYIETGGTERNYYTISITDISGKIIDVQQNKINNRIEIGVNELLNGMYFIVVESPSRKEVVKFIKK